jgi:hypothetical protein
MSQKDDFRADKLSLEGRGIAQSRYEAFVLNELDDVLSDAIDPDRPPRAPMPTHASIDELEADLGPMRELRQELEEAKERIAMTAKERSELIGFWCAWHMAGGFARLESGGWHRATIYRKIHRFRATFGAHPDEYEFPWIQLDRRRFWAERVRQQVDAAASYDDDFEPPDDLDDFERPDPFEQPDAFEPDL